MEPSQVVLALAALAQESRLDLVRLLAAAGPAGLPAGEIAAKLHVVPSTLSFHLNTLETAGLIRPTRKGRSIIYAIQLSHLRNVVVSLAQACCAAEQNIVDSLLRLVPSLPDEDAHLTPAFNVLFLCTHNSARSIMAEAILNKIGSTRFRAWSAGSTPVSGPMPSVIAQLEALGHDVTDLRSKGWTMFSGPVAPRMDFVIALCDPLDAQACPDFGERAITAAWPLPDPQKFMGSDAEKAMLLNELYASLRRRMEVFMSLPFATLDRLAVKARLDEIGGAVRA